MNIQRYPILSLYTPPLTLSSVLRSTPASIVVVVTSAHAATMEDNTCTSMFDIVVSTNTINLTMNMKETKVRPVTLPPSQMTSPYASKRIDLQLREKIGIGAESKTYNEND